MDCHTKTLEDLTGCSFKTIKKKLSSVGISPVKVSQKGTFYDSGEALRAIYAGQAQEELNLQEERAKLAKAQTEKTQYETEKLKKNLVSAEDVVSEWSKYINNVRSKLLLLPTKMSKDLKGITEAKDIERILEDAIYECLTDLSRGGFDGG